MATANTTSADEGANIRPMLCQSDTQTEAINSVRNVLLFMSVVLRDGIDFGGNKQIIDGAGLILETCSETLSFHLPAGQKGGAA